MTAEHHPAARPDAPTCQTCHAPTADGIALCDAHADDLRRLLEHIPDTLAESVTTTARMDRIGQTIGGSSAPADGVNAECMDRAAELRGLLFSWARCLLDEADERGVAVGRYGEDYARLLLDHVALIRCSSWAGDCLDELTRAHRRLVQAVDIPPDLRSYGACSLEECPGTIRGHVGAPTAVCRACGGVYDAAELIAWAVGNAWEHAAPLASVLRALGAVGITIPSGPAGRWVHEGRLKPAARDARGRSLFTMADVVAARSRQ